MIVASLEAARIPSLVITPATGKSPKAAAPMVSVQAMSIPTGLITLLNRGQFTSTDNSAKSNHVAN